jgi:hypothetical protein
MPNLAPLTTWWWRSRRDDRQDYRGDRQDDRGDRRDARQDRRRRGPGLSGEHELDDQTGRVPVGIHLRSADQSLAGITANGSAEAVYLVNFTDAHDAKLFPRGPLRTAFPRRRPSPVGFIWSLTAYTAQDKNLEV